MFRGHFRRFGRFHTRPGSYTNNSTLLTIFGITIPFDIYSLLYTIIITVAILYRKKNEPGISYWKTIIYVGCPLCFCSFVEGTTG